MKDVGCGVSSTRALVNLRLRSEETMTEPRVWVIGAFGVGKRSLVRALGAAPVEDASAPEQYTWKATPSEPALRFALCHEWPAGHNVASPHDVVVLVFALNHKDSFAATLRHWARFTGGAKHHHARVLLVGTMLDRPDERQVFASEAAELAVIDFDEYVEVSSVHPPFEGVMYARQLLLAWVQDLQAEAYSVPSPVSQRSVGTPRGAEASSDSRYIRTSVWLYDPMEESCAATNPGDVRLRPISRALFEMREAGGDKAKSQIRRRDQSMANVVTRSRYYGPTESSRHMRWQAQQKVSTPSRRRHTRTVSVEEDHARLQNKSFLQTTKLMQERMAHVKHNVTTAHKTLFRYNAKSDTAESSATGIGKQAQARARATSHGDQLKASHSSRQVKEHQVSPTVHSGKQITEPPISPPIRFSEPTCVGLLDADNATLLAECPVDWSLDDQEIHIPPPPAPARMADFRGLSITTSSIKESSSPRTDVCASPQMIVNDRTDDISDARSCEPQYADQCFSPVDTIKESALVADDSDTSDDDFHGATASDIDDLLDYFDGVTIPLE